MNSSKLLSGRVPVTGYANLSSDRYQFLGLSQAEPSLGVPSTSGSLFTSTSNGIVILFLIQVHLPDKY